MKMEFCQGIPSKYWAQIQKPVALWAQTQWARLLYEPAVFVRSEATLVVSRLHTIDSFAALLGIKAESTIRY